MKCQKCDSSRVLCFTAHCKDGFYCDLEGIEYEGYVPNDFMSFGYEDDSNKNTSFRYSDDVNMNVCLDCGQVQGNFPNRKIKDLEPDLSEVTVETMFEYSKMNHKCEMCKELVEELEYDSSPGERLENFKKWFFNHQAVSHNRCGTF